MSGQIKQVYIALGSNIQAPDVMTDKALEMLQQLGTINKVSSKYRTPPWGFASANDFLNMVLELHTSLDPLQLLSQTQAIEQSLGRAPKIGEGYQDRPIDIDILDYQGISMDTEQLKLPHPLIAERLFVLIPWAEIAPQCRPSQFEKTIDDLVKSCPDKSTVTPW